MPARALDAIDRRGEELLSGLDPGRGRRRLTAADVEAAAAPAAALAAALVQLAEALRAGARTRPACAPRSAPWTTSARASPSRTRTRSPGPSRRARLGADRRVETLRELLWEREAVCVLVSATLEPRFLRGRLGLDDAREVSLPSPYDFAEQALLYVPRAFPEPRSPGYDERLADEVLALCSLSEGRALVLTTSYSRLDALADRVAPRIPYPVLVQGEAPRERLLERFRDEVDSVLIATQTFWQGVDVQGESLSLLVIDKLPFAAPNDPLVEARCERIAKEGGDWFAEYAVPAAVLQLRQGCRDPRPRRSWSRRDPRSAPPHPRLRPPLSRRAPGPARRGPGLGRGLPGCEGARHRLIPFSAPWPRRTEFPHRPSGLFRRPRPTRPRPTRADPADLHRLAAAILVAAAAIGAAFILSGDDSSASGPSAQGDCTFETFDALEASHVEELAQDYEYNSIPATSGPHSGPRRSGTPTTSPFPRSTRSTTSSTEGSWSVRERGAGHRGRRLASWYRRIRAA